MTAQQLDSLGYRPIAGATKPIMYMILRLKGDRNCHKYITWSHDNKHFVDPEILNSFEKDKVKDILRKNKLLTKVM